MITRLRAADLYDALGKRIKREYGEFVDEGGHPVRKTKYSHPYNYDPFVLWQGEGESNAADYSDRLLQWDYDKHNELCMKHFGNVRQRWNDRDPQKIEAFLRDYHNRPEIKLVKIMEMCNVSSGYPLWCFFYWYDQSADVTP
jgi:hypothetical protein